MNNMPEHPSLTDLRSVPSFEDLPEEQLEWLSSHMRLQQFEDGDTIAREGDPAEELVVFFEGELRAERKDGRIFRAVAGQITGLIPYSRMTHFASNVKAGGKSRGAALHKDHFAEMLEHIPILHQRLVGILSERIRDDAAGQQQREKLMALGKISAGLAHELNNPAAAARRAADNLLKALESMHAANLALEERGVSSPSRLFLARIEQEWSKNACKLSALDTLERSEREEEFQAWLEDRNIHRAWESAAALVDAGCTTIENLEEISRQIPAEFLQDAIFRITASFTATRLVGEIQSSVGRMSDLVRAVKEYSYMDQAPEQRVDIHEGLENTLIMLRHRLKDGIDISRQYDRTIPKLSVHGSELNQVWTNLIGNAADAMDGKGKLKIQTSRTDHQVSITITDSGPGIPPEIQNRMFEQFFTTKPVGQGTGLGLDVSRRIVKNHSGDITFESVPGKTSFTVRLPIKE